MEPIRYDPGIFGFVKAQRHHTGSVLAMSHHDEADPPIFLLYWVKRLHPFAKPYWLHSVPVRNRRSRQFAEDEYERMFWCGPPPFAICDRQRSRVYRWEEEVIFPGYPEWTWRGCQRFLRQVWNHVGDQHDIVLTNRRRFQHAISLGGVIHLPSTDASYFYRKPVILHEVAHELTPGQQHNAIFVKVYMSLCARFLGMDQAFLRDTAMQYDVDFS